MVGCGQSLLEFDIVATTGPVYEFTVALCQGTNIHVGQLITEQVSCLHDYSLQTVQLRMLESADAVIISGAGLEDFLDPSLLSGKHIIDSSEGIVLHCDHEDTHTEHEHIQDPHIWLSPVNAKKMAENIANGLSILYPQYQESITANLQQLLPQFDALQEYGEDQLSQLSSRELITFHDGFGYLAESFDLHILRAIEEESGSEASAAELKDLILLVRSHDLPAIFVEQNGSVSAANIICQETGAKSFSLNMAMSGGSYFTAMYHNIDTLKEALG